MRLALNQFASMLIEEARDISGLSVGELDEQLGLGQGQCQRYATHPPSARSRAPQADEIQNLENLVARLLKRPAHIILLEDSSKTSSRGMTGAILGPPDLGMNLRNGEASDYQLGYEDDWPTYRRLKYGRAINGVRTLDLYCWQWGCLWDRGILPEPWTRGTQGLSERTAIEPFLESLVAEWKRRKELDEFIVTIGIKVFSESANDLFAHLFSALNEEILMKLRQFDKAHLEIFFIKLRQCAEAAAIKGLSSLERSP